MLIVYSGASPLSRRSFTAVINDNASKEIVFRLDRLQDSIDLAEMSCFVKVEDGEYLDKDVPGSIDVSERTIDVHWPLKRKTTAHEHALVQLQFEGRDEDIVWQTEAIAISMSRTVPADEYIENNYPSILQEQERHIDALDRYAHGKVREIQGDLSDLDSRKVSKTDVTFQYNALTGAVTLGIGNSPVTGEPMYLTINLPMDLIVSGGYYDASTQEIVLALTRGGEIRIPAGSLVSQIQAGETSTIVCSYDAVTNTITADLKSGSVGMNHLDSEVRDAIEMKSAFELEYGERESTEFSGVVLPYYELKYLDGISVIETESEEFPGVELPSIVITF